MALTLNAEQKSIYNIFMGKRQYLIPPYQRPYSWQLQHCKKLFEDLKREFYNEKKEGYFLGNIVLAWSAESRDLFEVIDGQQRLTTLLLLLKALLAFDSENSNIKNAIWIVDERTQEIKDERLRFSDYVMNSHFYKEILELDLDSDVCNKEIDEQNLFMQNLCYFYKEIEEMSQYEKIENFVDFLLYDVSLLPIETGDGTAKEAREKALTIFETINNRGLNLSNSDIFKARLYEMALNELEEDKFISLWSEFENSVSQTNYSIDDIFHIYMHIIRGEVGVTQDIEVRDFFIQDRYSPFNDKIYNEILNDLLKIIRLIEFFRDVTREPKRYKQLTKIFQTIELFSFSRMKNALFIYLYTHSIDNENLIDFSENLLRCFFCKPSYFYIDMFFNDLAIEIIHGKEFKYYISDEIKIVEVFNSPVYQTTLLDYYLDSQKKIIYPYYQDSIIENFLVTFDYDNISINRIIKFLRNQNED